jgi:hypothetical protein
MSAKPFSRMRRAGAWLLQLWMPDPRGRGFAGECRRQSRGAAKNGRVESEVLEWIAADHDDEGWTP